jgi:anaerobic carbon-monoxide dehydrogenase iron sulfur subunit
MQTVFVNPERCIGCLQCEFACAVEHSTTGVPAAAISEQPLPRKRIHVQAGLNPNTAFPNKCRHCDPAPCQQVCPTGAIYRDPLHDVVLIDAAKCIGCAMCAMVCPFDVLTFYPATAGVGGNAVAVKCDACIARLRAGQIPACVEVCKVGALEFGDLNDLVAAGRQRETAAVLAATTMGEPAQPAPQTIGAWRSLGAIPGHQGGAR